MDHRVTWTLIAMVMVVGLAACSSDRPIGSSPNCDEDQLYDEHEDVCVDQNDGDNAGAPDAGGDGGDVEDNGGGNDDNEITECDQDGDGFERVECGGLDCDDDNADIRPDVAEECDEVDRNCDGFPRQGLECTFYAHTDGGLYSIDPFEQTANKEADLQTRNGEETGLLDIDTHPDGHLYGVSWSALYVFVDAENYWFQVASLSDLGDPTGMAIDNDGTAYITNEDHFYRLDLADIEEALSTHGFDESSFPSLHYDPDRVELSGGEFYSSGDCVVTGKNSLFMTSKDDGNPEDELVNIDRSSGESSSVGRIGFDDVYGLTFGWGRMYGTTLDGELITINSDTGEYELLGEFEDRSWYGAASTPGR